MAKILGFDFFTTKPNKVDLSASKPVMGALGDAARLTGADFNYLVNTATKESSLNPNASARTSSAEGLFQFIDQTWLEMVEKYGEKYGLGNYAEAISKDQRGRRAIADPNVEAAVMDLKKNPTLSAIMGGHLAQENAQKLEENLGRKVTSGEAYVAHVFGANGAKELLSLNERNPDAIASRYFGKEARANRGLFYSSGRPVTVSELVTRLTRDFDNGPVAVAGVGEGVNGGGASHIAAQSLYARHSDDGRGGILQSLFMAEAMVQGAHSEGGRAAGVDATPRPPEVGMRPDAIKSAVEFNKGAITMVGRGQGSNAGAIPAIKTALLQDVQGEQKSQADRLIGLKSYEKAPINLDDFSAPVQTQNTAAFGARSFFAG